MEFLKSILANEKVETVFWLLGKSKSLLSFISVEISVLFFAVSTIDIKSLVDIRKFFFCPLYKRQVLINIIQHGSSHQLFFYS